ncbi:unnamed protein product [Caenorhabditis sp. 36 PRJEB53466]|nr:unnamed protein product [Caenorhabditis sp. 36 PRJEB53466]
MEFESGNALLVKGKFGDALPHYHKAIELDPSNYQAIYRRATAYLALGRPKPGLADLDSVLEQKPDFTGARQQRANVLFKLGQLEEAAVDFQYLIDNSSSNTDATEQLKTVERHQRDMDILRHSAASGNCEAVEAMATELMELQSWDASLYRYRAKCYEKGNKLKAAIHDMKHASKLSSDSTEILFEMSELQYKVTEIRDSLSTIRECLKLNPDHKKCFASYKSVRKIVKSLDSMKSAIENQEWSKCLEVGEKLRKSNEEDVALKMNLLRLTCQCNREEGNIGAAVEECTRVIEYDDSDVDTLIQRAEAYMLDEEYDLAIADFEKAAELDSLNEAAKTGTEQAKRAKELIGKRDYYKILGVRRNANKREITKAYRKQAQKWHPDNFSDEKEKKKAEKKFIDIAAAKEVLSDEEKRRAFDSGNDPLDPQESQRGQNGRGGFNPFGGGRGDFFFHF